MVADLNDEELMVRVQHDDDAAFEELVRRHGDALKGYIRTKAGNEATADDLSQETWLKLWLFRHRYDPKKGRFKSWLFTIADHVFIDNFRKRWPVLLADVQVPEPEAPDAAIFDHTEDSPEESAPDERIVVTFSSRLRRCMEKLPDDERLMFIAMYVEAFDLKLMTVLLGRVRWSRHAVTTPSTPSQPPPSRSTASRTAQTALIRVRWCMKISGERLSRSRVRVMPATPDLDADLIDGKSTFEFIVWDSNSTRRDVWAEITCSGTSWGRVIEAKHMKSLGPVGYWYKTIGETHPSLLSLRLAFGPNSSDSVEVHLA